MGTHLKHLIMSSLLFCGFFYEVYFLMRMSPHLLEQQALNADHPKFSDLWEPCLYAVGFVVLMIAYQQIMTPVFRKFFIPRKTHWDMQLWLAKVDRACSSSLKLAIYAATQLQWFFIMKDAPWVPWQLGGSGNIKLVWQDRSTSPDVKWLYMVMMGYYLSELIVTFKETNRPDFLEMLLHHFVTVSLVGLSFVCDFMRLGSLVILTHGVTDVSIYASKLFVDTPYTSLIMATYGSLVVSFFYFRLYVFPFCILKSSWVDAKKHLSPLETEVAWPFFNGFLSILYLLHVYWYCLVLRSGFILFKTGQAKDMVANLSSMALNASGRLSINVNEASSSEMPQDKKKQ